MAFIDTYFKEVEQRFAVMKQEREPLEQAARLLFEAEKEHHTIYTFGSGHSHMIGQDIYARAGGYAKVYPINEIEMTLATHPTKSTTLERTIASRHESGLRLFELADVILDNHAPYGDATTPIDEATSMGPGSTLTGCFLAQCVMGRFVELLKEHGMEAPVFASSNMDGADERNRELFDKYVIKTVK